jgi:hypothetical protein
VFTSIQPKVVLRIRLPVLSVKAFALFGHDSATINEGSAFFHRPERRYSRIFSYLLEYAN